MPAIQPINPALTFVGPKSPLRPPTKREQYPLRLNETISLSDEVHGGEIQVNNAADKRAIKNPVRLIGQYRSMIEDHVERRIAIIFQQFVVAYGTHLHFEEGKTADQGESAPALYIRDHQSRKEKLCVRNAAHSSTLPCLIAYEGAAWKRYEDHAEPKPDGYTYIKGGDVYRGANSTLAMPRDINEADIAIDGKKNENALRHATLKLLNRVSEGKITPFDAVQRFIKKMAELTTAKERGARKAGVKEALRLYSEVLENYRNGLDDETLLHMLGVQIDPQNQSDRVRKKVYELRFRAIRENQYGQAQIVEKVNRTAAAVLQRLNKAKKPDYFIDAFRYVLREEMNGAKNKARLDKLFNHPGEGYELRFTPSRKGRFDTTKALIQTELPFIQNFVRELRNDFRDLKNKEIQNRGRITRELRGMMDWSQSDLSRKIGRLFPHTAASQPTISRIENNIKLVDPLYAKQLATVFKVDAVLFMPAFYYD